MFLWPNCVLVGGKFPETFLTDRGVLHHCSGGGWVGIPAAGTGLTADG